VQGNNLMPLYRLASSMITAVDSRKIAAPGINTSYIRLTKAKDTSRLQGILKIRVRELLTNYG